MAQKIVSEFEKQELKRQESSKASEKSYADWQYEVECLKNKRESLIQQVLAGKQRQEEYQEMIENAAKTESRLLQGQTVINKQKQIEQLNKQVEELAHQLRLSHKEQADLSQQIFIKSQELEAAVLGKTQESESNQELYKQELEAQLQIIHELNQAKVELQNQVKELQSALQRKYVSPSKRLSSEGSAES